MKLRGIPNEVGALLLVSLSAGCARQAAPSEFSPAPHASDGSTVCEGLVDRFVGLPAMQDETATSPAPLAGRWWVRSCSTSRHGSELQVRLQGPGWYLVDERGSDLSLRQQVPFALGIEVAGRLSGQLSNGIFALRLVPRGEAKVDLRTSENLDVRASSAWGAVLRWAPLVPVRAMAAERFSHAVVDALQGELREGATATFDLGSGQGDVTLGKLARGRMPERPFDDDTRWLVNERLLLSPSSLHVLGPIDPGPTRLDVDVQQGVGVEYQAICARSLDENYSALASGRVAVVPTRAFVAKGTVRGAGLHTTDFVVPECRFYLVVSAVSGAPTTLAAVRVRA